MSITQMFPVESSNIAAFGYDPATKTLAAEFTNGTLYTYDAVPQEIFGQILAAESKGSTFNTLVKKGGFNFHKHEPKADA